jgi:hypothetical protein
LPPVVQQASINEHLFTAEQVNTAEKKPNLMPIQTYPAYNQLDYFAGPAGSYVGTPMPVYSSATVYHPGF